MFLLALGVAGLFVWLAQALGPRKPNAAKNTPFETGKVPFQQPSGRHSVRFYLPAMLFVLFDVELIFFFPWAVIYREIGIPGFVEMAIFMALLVLGFVYAWKKGALEWK